MNSKYYSAKMNRALREREKGAWMEVGGLEVGRYGSWDVWIIQVAILKNQRGE